jgi:hypothetical protein
MLPKAFLQFHEPICPQPPWDAFRRVGRKGNATNSAVEGNMLPYRTIAVQKSNIAARMEEDHK